MRSMDLLVYRPEEAALELRAKDCNSAWMVAVEILDDDTFLGAENSFNLFTLRKNSDAASDEDRSVLEVSAPPPPPPKPHSLLSCLPLASGKRSHPEGHLRASIIDRLAWSHHDGNIVNVTRPMNFQPRAPAEAD